MSNKPLYYDPETGRPSNAAIYLSRAGNPDQYEGELARLERDRDEALAAQPADWMREYARHSGCWMHVRPDPTGYETREIAPGPETGAQWSEGALRKRGGGCTMTERPILFSGAMVRAIRMGSPASGLQLQGGGGVDGTLRTVPHAC